MRKIKDIYKYIKGKYNGMPIMAILILIILMIISGGLRQKEIKENISEKEQNTELEYSDQFIDEEDDTLSIYGIKEIKIDEESAEAELYYLNPEQNADRYYIRVSIIMKSTDETVYVSDLIPPGQGIRKIKIDRQLEKGVYPAVFHIQGYKMNDLSSVKGADLDIDLIVE
jgi:hypothetical protein